MSELNNIEVKTEYERGINVTVRDLKECLKDLPDDMDVIIPVHVEGDENKILGFRHARTAGLLATPTEEKPALCIATARDGADMYSLMRINAGRETSCIYQLF